MRRSVLFLMLVALAMLAGCAGGKKAELVGDSAAVKVVAPQDSLRAKFVLTLVGADGKPQDLDAVLFSVSGKRYRMELTGPMGIGVASLLWTEDGWTMTFPTEKLYMKGNGYMVGLFSDNSLPLVHIHQVANLFDGKVLPENFDVVEEKDQVIYAREKSGRAFSFAKQDARVTWLSRAGRDGKPETLLFKDYKTFEGVETPSVIEFQRDGKDYLSIRIKKVTRNKPFSLGTWRLNVPKSFSPVGG